jgi:hypothetical protein
MGFGRIGFNGMVVAFFLSSIWLTIHPKMVSAIGWDEGYGARSAGMGYCNLTLTDLWSVGNNQAGLAWIQGWQVGLYAENRFIMEALNRESLALVWGGKPGTFGLLTSYYGFPLYNEWLTGITYARKFGHRFGAGIQFHYLRIGMGPNYNALQVFSGTIGLLAKPDDRWTIGFQVQNPIPLKLTRESKEILPVRFRLGGSFNIRNRVLIAIEGAKGLEGPFQFRTGLDIRIVRFFQGRFGIGTEPFVITAGIGFQWNKWAIDLATEYHILLGFSPAISISWRMRK